MAESLVSLKKKAGELYLKAMDFDDLDCGRTLAEFLRPHIALARVEFGEVWEQVKAIDPSAPENPFLGVEA